RGDRGGHRRSGPGANRDHRARAAVRDARGALPGDDRTWREGGCRVSFAVGRVYRWELLKLLAQKRTYLGVGAAVAIPLIFTTVLLLKSGGPNDVPLGRYIRESGLALPF